MNVYLSAFSQDAELVLMRTTKHQEPPTNVSTRHHSVGRVNPASVSLLFVLKLKMQTMNSSVELAVLTKTVLGLTSAAMELAKRAAKAPGRDEDFWVLGPCERAKHLLICSGFGLNIPYPNFPVARLSVQPFDDVICQF
ncbi:MAG: hypothetical protein GY822_23935 [Deltaproteobacteria bacterium]|nr:hypothetical protein [Deltaproteobacteria bacterium]